MVVGVPGKPPWRVVVAGRPVVEGGRLVHGDIHDHAREDAARLWDRMLAM